METREKIIEFETYCQKCQYFSQDEADPKSKCWDCLDNPVGINSRRPVNFKEVDKV